MRWRLLASLAVVANLACQSGGSRPQAPGGSSGSGVVGGSGAIGRLLYGTGRSSIWIPVACGSVLACALDLRRLRSAGPGRLVAWSVLSIAVVAGIVFAVAPPD